MSWTVPKTWNVGDIGTAADLNAYVRDNSNFLYGTPWQNPSAYENGWTAYSGQPPQYRLSGTDLQLSGLLVPGTFGAVAFVLPTGFIPSAPCQLLVCTDAGGNGIGRLIFGTDGSVVPWSGGGGTAWFALNGVRVPALI
jgi:hypothetical protein